MASKLGPNPVDGPPSTRRHRIRGWLVNLGLLAVSAALSLLLAEFVLRVLSPGYSPLFLSVYQMDDHDLVLLKPGVERRHVSAEWRVNVGANADGLRDYATPRPDTGGTVLGVGDSFAFGWGVELEEGFLAQAEARLAPRAVRVVKAGLPGSGPGDYARFLQHYGERYAPDVVAVSVFVGNDFNDVQMGGIPGQFRVRDGVMVKATIDEEEARTPPLWYRMKEWLKHSSLLVQELAQTWWHFEQAYIAPQDRDNPGLNVGDRWLWEFAKVHLRNPPPETEKAYEMTLLELDGIAEWCRAHSAQLLLIVIPRSFQLYGWELQRWKAAYRLADAQLDLDRPQRVLTEWATSRHVPLLDLLPPFRVHATARPDDRLYFYPNSHMSRAGHALAGRLLADSVAGLLNARVRSVSAP